MRLIKSIFILLLALLSTQQVAYSQLITNSGTDFWLAFPEFYDLTRAKYIIYISANENTSGTVSIPGTNFSSNFTTIKGQVTKVNLIPADATLTQTETVLDRGIHVVSNDPVSVYAGTIHSARSEASLILPVPSLGNSYRVMSYPTQTKSGALRRSEFIVVAVEDQTDIRITPACKTTGAKPKGVAFTVRLNKGEVYMVQADALGDDLSGSLVESIGTKKNFALFGGHVWVQMLCGQNADPLYEQMFPINSWGKSYILLPTPTSGRDVARVMAAKDNTRVKFNGGSDVVLQKGEVHEFVYTETQIVSSLSPIQVGIFTITASGCSNSPHGDPSMIMVNSNEQMLLDSITFFTVDDYAIAESYIHVITRTSDTAVMEINSSPLTGFSELKNDSFYSSTSFKVPAGNYNLTTKGCGFLAYAIGLGNAESYAYAAGVSLIDLSCEMSVRSLDPTCTKLLTGSRIEFKACQKNTHYVYKWLFDDGRSGTGYTYNRIFDKPGTFKVKLVVISPCAADTTEAVFTIFPDTRVANLFPDTVICNNPKGVTIDVVRSGYSNYRWNDGNTDSIRTVFQPGTYIVSVLDKSGCTVKDTVIITPRALPEGALEAEYVLCENDSLFLDVGVEGLDYEWNPPNHNASVVHVSEEGKFKVKISDHL